MRSNRRTTRRLFLVMMAVAAVLVAALPLATSKAQSANVVIQLVVPSQQRDAYSDQLIQDFQTAHPGVTVKVIKVDASVPSPVNGVAAYLTALQSYVSAGDVLYIDPRRTQITEAATEAGLLLNLAPIVNTDQTLKVDDFYPAIWQSFQWDKGIWALPTSADITMMAYYKSAFDNAGLSYPSDKWTIDDLITAVTKLTQKDSNGKVVATGINFGGGFGGNNQTALFRSLLNDNLFDPNAVPNPPQIDKPALETMLDAWATQVVQPGLLTISGTNANVQPPIQITSGAQLLFPRPGNTSSETPVPMLLPGGHATVQATGFAVSAGTQYPEQAYALAAFLTTRSDISGRGTLINARKSLAGAQNNSSGNAGGPGFQRTITPEIQAVIDQAMQNGIPYADMRYTEYLNSAIRQIVPGTDAKTALQAVEATAVTDQQTAVAFAGTNKVAVATPVPVVQLAGGKVGLNFAVTSNVSPLPNLDKWNKVIADFVSSDPQVGAVNLDTASQFGGSAFTTLTANYDCFYLNYNAVPNQDLGTLLPLDSIMSADTSFDKSDVVGGALAQLQRDNKTWALPVNINPGILRYDATQFDQAHVPQPAADWTIANFIDAVKQLKPDPSVAAPFQASNANGTHLLILIAAYGGVPLDYRTSPPTINFTDPKTVDAIRQVLDLAKQGYIKYDALGTIDFGGNRVDRTVPIYTDTLNAFNFRLPAPTTTSDVSKPAIYPRGDQYAGVTYSIGTGYVSAKSQNPEACYRWLTDVSRHPELFGAMPARVSLINDPTIAGQNGPDLTAIYSEIAKLLANPGTVTIPQLFGGGGNPTGFLVPHWLYQAFDAYVLNNGDLDSALKDAQTYAQGFEQCVASIPPFDPATQNQRDYNQQYATCATKVDPSIKNLFGG